MKRWKDRPISALTRLGLFSVMKNFLNTEHAHNLRENYFSKVSTEKRMIKTIVMRSAR
jgi:hypothetical protein